MSNYEDNVFEPIPENFIEDLDKILSYKGVGLFK